MLSRRFLKILFVLLRYGGPDLWMLTSVGRWWYNFKYRRLTAEERAAKRWVRWRKALEQLGTTFIKFGQMVSNRPGLIPAALQQELAKLQDAVPPFPIDVVRATIYEQLGDTPERLFAEFNPVPVASASIAQVHEAQLLTGEHVVVKVQRPGLDRLVREDISAFKRIAAWLERWSKEMERAQAVAMIEAFERSIYEELDFELEAGYAMRFKEQFAKEPRAKVPQVYPAYTAKKILVLEYVTGIKINDLEALRDAGYELPQLAKVGFDLYFKQIFQYGFFHADPHPGNLFIQPGGVLCFIDFGMMGKVTEGDRRQLGNIIIALAQSDRELLVQGIEQLSRNKVPNREAFKDHIFEFIDNYSKTPVSEINVLNLFEEIRDTAYRYQLRVNPDLYLLLRTLNLLEGLGTTLDPKFNSIAALKPYAVDLLRANSDLITGGKGLRSLAKSVWGTAKSLLGLPTAAKRTLDKVERGNIQVLQETSYSPLVEQFWERMINRVLLAWLGTLFLGGGFWVSSPYCWILWVAGTWIWLVVLKQILRAGRG